MIRLQKCLFKQGKFIHEWYFETFVTLNKGKKKQLFPSLLQDNTLGKEVQD